MPVAPPADSVSQYGDSLSPADVARGMNLSFAHGFLMSVYFSATGGMFLTGYALKMQASNIDIGIVAALGSVAAAMQLGASYVVERSGKRKALAVIARCLSIGIWLGIIAIPYLVPDEMASIRLPLLFAMLAVCYTFANVSYNAWLSWISDLAPVERRGWFFARRNMWASITGMFASMAEGTFLDWVPNLRGFAAIFLVGIGFGGSAQWVLARHPEPPMARAAERPNFRRLTGQALAHRPLRNLIAFAVAWTFATAVAQPFYMVYMIKALQIPYLVISLFAALGGLVAIVALPVWGRLLDRYGNKPVLTLCCLCTATQSLVWIVTDKVNFPFLLPVIYVVNGAMNAGFGLSSLNMLLAVSPRECRSVYTALYGAVTGVFGAAAPILGGTVAEALRNANLRPFGLSDLQVTFAVTSVLCYVALVWLRRVHEAQETSLAAMLRQATAWRPRGQGA